MLQLNPDSATPLFEQIRSHWVFRIARGDLPPGELLPSVRELAQSLLVHPNTIVRAYQELESAGVISARRGVGMEVTTGARAICETLRGTILATRLREFLMEARQGGIPKSEILKLVRAELQNLEEKP